MAAVPNESKKRLQALIGQKKNISVQRNFFHTTTKMKDVLLVILRHLDDVVLLRACIFSNKQIASLCRSKLNLIRDKKTFVERRYDNTFRFYTLDYEKREIHAKNLTFRQLAHVMIETADILGKGYTMRLSSASESGFTMHAPGNRECEIRFSLDEGEVKVRNLKGFYQYGRRFLVQIPPNSLFRQIFRPRTLIPD